MAGGSGVTAACNKLFLDLFPSIFVLVEIQIKTERKRK
jgi:hypothetical protein